MDEPKNTLPRILKRFSLLLVLLFVSGIFGLSETQQNYNVVLISIDSLRADHMGVYGYTRNTTPFIDAFSKDAIVFDSYFSTSMLTPISEMSVHTGMYPFSNGIINFESVLFPTVETLAEVLRREGWQTASFGSSVEFDLPIMKTSFSRGFDTYVGNSYFDSPTLPWFGRNDPHTEETLQWLSEAQARKKPFFLWVRVGSVHWPYGFDEPNHFSDPAYDGPMKTDEYSAQIREVESVFSSRYGLIWKGREYGENSNRSAADVARDIAYIGNRYDDGIVKTDRELAPLLAYLSQKDIANRTIVIIQSEHGEGLGERGYVSHFDISDTETRVPLIIKMPGRTPKRVEGLISGVDIFPTLLSLLNLPQRNVDGTNYASRMKNPESAPPRSEVFLTRTPLWERVIRADEPWLSGFIPKDDIVHYHDTAVRTEDWKLIHRKARMAEEKYSWFGHISGVPLIRPEYELFNVKADPLEGTDVYVQYPQIVESLKKRLDEWEHAMEDRGTIHTIRSKVQPYF